jgi:hypothetical protein
MIVRRPTCLHLYTLRRIHSPRVREIPRWALDTPVLRRIGIHRARNTRVPVLRAHPGLARLTTKRRALRPVDFQKLDLSRHV